MKHLPQIAKYGRTPRAWLSAICSVALVFAAGAETLAADKSSPSPRATAARPRTQAQPQQGAPATDQSPAQQSQAGQPQVAEGDQQQQRLVSLVLLTHNPRKLTHDQIAHAVSEGIGAQVSADDVVSKPPYHLVTVGRDKFIINDIAEPYFEKPAQVADEIKNQNLSRAVREHHAWVSVDWVSDEAQPDLEKVYDMIGKMVAHLSDKETLALYSPDMDQFALWAPAVRDGLESGDPLSVFAPSDAGQPAQTGGSSDAAPPQPATAATP